MAEYIGEDGRKLSTSEETKEYSQLIRETLSYDNQEISFDGETYNVKIIHKEQYTPEMLQIAEKGKHIGVKIKLTLKSQEADYDTKLFCVGTYWSGENQFIDAKRSGTLEQTINHELAHAIFDKLHGWQILGVNDWIDYLRNNYPEEFQRHFEDYSDV